MKKVLVLSLVLYVFPLFSQEKTLSNTGMFSLGVRSTLSAFNDIEEESLGSGFGGQFRIQLAERVNTEWFADYFNSTIGDYGRRTDYHIGWSVMYYVLKPEPSQRLKPYVLAGHCFDYTRVQGNALASEVGDRWSSAVQAGIGTHYQFSPRFDVSLTTQYMMHLGKHLHFHESNSGELHIHESTGNGLEGHLLFTLSFNYKLFNLWHKK